ncbi:MAG: phosphotransferase, partial [Bdellovibrionales bacterium]|nr:phosphotransferase [Bdellovibrionales bacterium]
RLPSVFTLPMLHEVTPSLRFSAQDYLGAGVESYRFTLPDEEVSKDASGSHVLTSEQMKQFVALTKSPPEKISGLLGGRTGLIRGNVPGFGQIVLKSYRRGGALRKILPSCGLSLLPSRALREMKALMSVRSFGVNAPAPLLVISRGRFFRREWLVMEELPEHRTLVQISTQAPDELERYVSLATRQIEALIQYQILHVDLHPGNVLVTPDGRVYLVDFDHAERVTLPRSVIRDRYLRRWRRAVIKHGLSDELSELLCAGLLRRSPDE